VGTDDPRGVPATDEVTWDRRGVRAKGETREQQVNKALRTGQIFFLDCPDPFGVYSSIDCIHRLLAPLRSRYYECIAHALLCSWLSANLSHAFSTICRLGGGHSRKEDWVWRQFCREKQRWNSYHERTKGLIVKSTHD